MHDEIFFEGTKYISASKAGSFAGITRDHISRLCKEGKIEGKRVGRSWYVSERSLRLFAVMHRQKKALRAEILARERRSEYEAAKNRIAEQLASAMNAPAGASHAALAAAHIPVYAVTPMLEAAHKLLAVTMAVIIVFGAYALFDPRSVAALLAGMQAGMHDETHAAADAYASASRIDVTVGLKAVAENGDGEFAAAAASPDGIFDVVGNAIARDFDGFARSLQRVIFPADTVAVSGTAASGSTGFLAPTPDQSPPRPISAVPAAPSVVIRKIYVNGTSSIQSALPQQAAPERIDRTGYVTQDSLASQLDSLKTSITALVNRSIGTPYSPPGTAEGFATAAEAVNNIGSLNGVTISNAAIVNSSGTGAGGATALSKLSDVSIPSPASGELLAYNGSAWTGISTSSLGITGMTQWTTSSSSISYSLGNVGIGTSTPSAEFAISAQNGTGYPGNLLFDIASSTSNSTSTLFTVTNAGNIGIGTSTPGSLFSVAGIGNWTGATSTMYSTGGINLTAGCFAIVGNCIGTLIGTAGQSLYFSGTNAAVGTSTLFISTAGNIGIGTSTPFAKLHIVGGSTGNVLELDSSASAASTTMATFSNAGLFSVGDDIGYSSGVFSVDASSSTTTISNLSIGNIVFDTDAGVVNLSDLPVDSNASQGTLESQSINIGGNPLITAYGVANGTGGLQSFGVGIGTTTTPYSMLEVWGSDAASSTPVFSVVNNASTTEFTVFDGGNAQLAGTLTQNSDQRLKTNITPLSASTSLSMLNALNPVTFNWIDTNEGTTPQIGFIAQQVQHVFPNLVSTTSPTALTPDGTLGVNYIGFIAPIISAIQDISARIAAVEQDITQLASLITTQEVDTQKLCVGQVCVTQAQFLAMVEAANQSASASSSASGTIGNVGTSDVPHSSSSSTPPIISVSGNNPATVDVGASYNDLGATITGPTADLNLGISASVDGATSTPISDITVDTTVAGTHSITYSATDQNGLTSTATRTVNVIAPEQNPATPAASSTPASDASSTAAISTGQ